MGRISVLFLFICVSSFASVGETFGPATTSSALANQVNPRLNDSSNNYHHPSLLAFEPKLNASFNIFRIDSKFAEIDNVVIENTLTSLGQAQGKTQTDYKAENIFAGHIAIPLSSKKAALGLSLFVPLNPAIKSDTGDPFEPEYVMYRGRFAQTQMSFNYARRFAESFSFSVGLFTGLQTSARMETRASLNASSNGSSGSVATAAKPTLGGKLGLAKKWNNTWVTALTFTQEMKSNLKGINEGETVNPNFVYDLSIESMMHYSPWEVKLTNVYKKTKWQLLTSVEYQIWDDYKTPVLRVKNLGGNIQSSDDFEQVDLRNIFIFRLGYKRDLTDKFSFMTGFAFRQTPLQGDFSGAGNSLDASTYIYTGGFNYKFSKDLTFGLNFGWHHLKTKQVTKTSGLENNGTGQKIGSPGYELAGHASQIGLGLQLNL